MKAVHMIAFILVLIGGLNWLIVGVTGDKDIFGLLNLGMMSDMLPKVVYILVGLSTIYVAATHKKSCRDCSGGSSGQSAMM